MKINTNYKFSLIMKEISKIICLLFFLISFYSSKASEIAIGLDDKKIIVTELWKKTIFSVKHIAIIQNKTSENVNLIIVKNKRDKIKDSIDTILNLNLKPLEIVKLEDVFLNARKKPNFAAFYYGSDFIGSYMLDKINKPNESDFNKGKILLRNFPNTGFNMTTDIIYNTRKFKYKKNFSIDIVMKYKELNRVGLPGCDLCGYYSPCSSCNPSNLSLKTIPVLNLEKRENEENIFKPLTNLQPPYKLSVNVEIIKKSKKKITYFSHLYTF
jgi:hypothetical protein